MKAHFRQSLAWVALTLSAAGFAACASPPDRARAATPKEGESPPKRAIEVTPADDPIVAELVEAHNRERGKADLPPLKLDKKLAAAARVQAADMAEHDKMAHEGSDGSTPPQRIERQGWHGQATGENVAEGQRTVEEVVDGWMHSPPHKKNILGEFGVMGAARAIARDGTPYWCVDFGLPWPVIDPEEAIGTVIAKLNRARSGANQPSLKANPKLVEAARRQARSMAERHRLTARGGRGPSPFEQLDATGYRYRRVDLAFASGVPTAADVARTWLKSPAQRKTILGDVADVGLGVSADDEGTPYWCLILAEPRD